MPLAPLWGVLTRSAGIGLVLAIVFGTLLFITRATEYIASNLFIAKMLVVAIGTANVLTFRILPTAQASEIASLHVKPPLPLRLAAGISLGTWLTALMLGRLIGYF